MSKLWRIGGIAVGIAAVVGFIITQLNVSEYNDYIEKVRPHLAAQDALVAEMQKTTDAEALEKLPGYIERAKGLEKKFEETAPSDEELKEIHQHLVNRASALTAYCEGMKGAYENNLNKEQAEAAMKHAAQAGEHLNAFVAARNAYGKKHNITFDDDK